MGPAVASSTVTKATDITVPTYILIRISSNLFYSTAVPPEPLSVFLSTRRASHQQRPYIREASNTPRDPMQNPKCVISTKTRVGVTNYPTETVYSSPCPGAAAANPGTCPIIFYSTCSAFDCLNNLQTALADYVQHVPGSKMEKTPNDYNTKNFQQWQKQRTRQGVMRRILRRAWSCPSKNVCVHVENTPIFSAILST